MYKRFALVIYNFYMHYIPNYIINKIPVYILRHFYYRYIMKLRIGKNSSIHMNVFINRNNIIIGNNSAINRNCYIDGRGKVVIGDNVSISPDVKIITADHDLDSKDFKFQKKETYIGDYSWIGTGAIILPGIRVGKGAVIAASSVVTKDVAPYQVVGGIPARIIKKRREDLEYTCKWFPPFD